MNDRERFVCIARGQTPDFVPIFGFPGAPGMSRGCMKKTHDRLVATGMPDTIRCGDVEAWYRYWGTTGPASLDFSSASGPEGIRTTSHLEDGFVIIEGEDGSVRREVIDNNQTYSMPEFRVYPVRDRDSWEFYRQRMTPRQVMDTEEVESNCRRFDTRSRPLVVSAGGTFGRVRSLMGTEAACLALYDDPGLVHDIIESIREHNRRHVFPLIERLKPEIVACWEDIGYKTGMLISPDAFREFCAPLYREVADVAHACGVTVLTVDSDGCAMELAGLVAECGFNSMHPFEAKGNNDLFALREAFPDFIMFGWLEKEVVNEGNAALIEPEILGKVPALLRHGRYFPNGDHGIQPLVTFPLMCRFMSLLHEVCGNPLGDFQRR